MAPVGKTHHTLLCFLRWSPDVTVANYRLDDMVRNTVKEVAELRTSIQYTQKDFDEIIQTMTSQSEQLSINTRCIDEATAGHRVKLKMASTKWKIRSAATTCESME